MTWNNGVVDTSPNYWGSGSPSGYRLNSEEELKPQPNRLEQPLEQPPNPEHQGWWDKFKQKSTEVILSGAGTFLGDVVEHKSVYLRVGLVALALILATGIAMAGLGLASVTFGTVILPLIVGGIVVTGVGLLWLATSA